MWPPEKCTLKTHSEHRIDDVTTCDTHFVTINGKSFSYIRHLTSRDHWDGDTDHKVLHAAGTWSYPEGDRDSIVLTGSQSLDLSDYKHAQDADDFHRRTESAFEMTLTQDELAGWTPV